MLLILACALLGSILSGWLLVRFESLHSHLSLDLAESGPQKFHARPTPRIGGIPIAAGLAAGVTCAVWQGRIDAAFAGALGLTLLPAVGSGLLEDLTKKLGPDMRLWASFLSALVAVLFFDAVVQRSGLSFVDAILSWYPIALLVTVVAVGGVAHAVNIIDGYNGLAGGVTVLMLIALGTVSWQLGDIELVTACVSLAGATLGFLVWNFPHGRLFAGDGGAYLWGVSVGLIAILLVHRHQQVSPWFALVVVAYPVFETLFSIYRRRFKKAAAAGLPDAKHLHQLIYRRLLHIRRVHRNERVQTRRNAATSPFLWALAALPVLPAMLFWNDTAALVGLSLGFALVYIWMYRAIARLSVPHWLLRLGRRGKRIILAREAHQTTEQQDPENRPVVVGNGNADRH